MLNSIVQNVRLTLLYDDDTRYSISRISYNADEEDVYKLAKSINSIQVKTINKIIKTVTKELSM